MKYDSFKVYLVQLLAIVSLVLFSLGCLGYRYYTTLGIDQETVENQQVLYRYYRFWWPGNGALLIGYGESWQVFNPGKQYDCFDLAGTLLRTPYKNIPMQSIWNRLGFWWIATETPKQRWLGVPSLLPAVCLALVWWKLRKPR